jgi:hypothetical protein
MKITVKKSVDQEIELPEFPFYVRKNEWQVYKIMNDKYCLAAADFSEPSIGVSYTSTALNEFENSELINEGIFSDFYNMVLTKIEENL